MSGAIAVIGMAGRFPGAPDVPAFWELLCEGREGLTRLDSATLAAEGVTAEVMADPRYVPVAAALHDIDRFDAPFWGMARHEAELMDPQQRILLETAWHALEDANVDPRRCDDAIGVFVGAAISTYLLFRLRERIAGPSTPSQLQAMIGNDKDYVATQLAYRLDLKGPAISVQTACSSSLVAVHLACQSLLAGECDIAIAGGVSVRVPHHVGYLYEAGGMLSPDGHCRSFAEGAEGTVFGSGCGLVVLRRLEDAGNDRARALILGSAVNNDGSRKQGFAAPSQDRQSAVIAEAMAVAGVRADAIGYVEGHGTGTALGDPIEVAALGAAFDSAGRGGCLLGSAKSNIGHTETAAGVAGLIKTVAMLERGMIVPTLHADVPSAKIPWAETPFVLARETPPWTERRIAGVSSFGIGGTNAHVIVAGAPEPRAAARQSAPRLLVSAADPKALAELVDAYRQRLEAQPECFPQLAAAAARRPRLASWVEARTAAALADAVPQQGPMPESTAATDGPPVDLPLYPFRRERYWVDDAEPGRALLGLPVRTPFDATLHPVMIDLARQGWLADHRVDGQILLPAAFHLALLIEAGQRVVSDFAIHAPLVLDGPQALQLCDGNNGTLRVMHEREGTWQCLAEARRAIPAPGSLPAWEVLGSETITAAAWAERMAAAGMPFGPAFRLFTGVHCGNGAARAELRPEGARNPVTLLDAGLQALGAAVREGGTGFRPVSIASFAVTGDLHAARTVLARLADETADAKTGHVLWLDAGGGIVAEARDILCRRARTGVDDMLYRVAWRSEDDPEAALVHAALERAACRFARDALEAAAPVRADLAGRLLRHAAEAEPGGAPGAVCRELAARHPRHTAEIELVARCGAALPEVLAGTRDPLDLLFGGADGVQGAYQDSPLGQRMNAVAAAVAAATRPRRVLEIGGGTAATTLALLPVLSETTEYLFTDISPAFTAAAARRLGAWPALRTATLDIARDPTSQGIEAGAWDLVVAANVLHATPDLRTTLHHACRLLAPGGRLLLVEGTEAQARLEITFGLTGGWNAHRDTDLRPDHPLISATRWCELLREARLEGPVVVTETGGQAVLTATAGPRRWLAMGRDPGLAHRLGLHFVPLGHALPQEPLDGVIALAGLEAHGEAADDLPTGDLLEVSRALLARQEAPHLLVPTCGAETVTPSDRPDPARAALGGFLRTLAREHPALRPRSVDLDCEEAAAAALAVEHVLADGESRVAWRGRGRLCARLERLKPSIPTPNAVRLTTKLTLDAMTKLQPGPGEVLVRVRAAGINYKDVLTATGRLAPLAAGLGGECAGEVEAIGPGVTGLRRGDAVVAVAGGALASHVVADARLVLPRPSALGFAQAAAVPIAGVTAWHALRHLAHLSPGQRALIHAATGGVGWFATRLAQAAGAEVVATAGSPAKRARLTDLGVREIYSSRTNDLGAAAPVDVVLGAMPPELREAAVRLVRPGGHFIEIGRVGIDAPETIAALRPDIHYHIVALDEVDAPIFAALLREVLAAVAADPSLLPPITTVPLDSARGAFEAMMRAEHVGKLVALPTQPAQIRADGTYVVTGGLGGLGPGIADWLKRRGAGGVIAVARRPAEGATPEQVVVGDVADPSTLRAVDARAQALGLPPVSGVVHAAGVLEDALIETMDPASLVRVAAPKLAGVQAILAHWPDLDLLVGFSSAGVLFGSAGQAAHTAASSALDAALASARAAGRPAVSVNWGAWRDLGAAAVRGMGANLAVRGMGSIDPGQGFGALDRILESGAPQAAVLPIDWPAMHAARAPEPLLRALMVEAATPPAAPAAPQAEAEVAMTAEARRAQLREQVAAACAGLLSPQSTIEPSRPLHDLGLDSLAALELRNRLGRLAGTVLPASLLFDHPTIAALTEHLATTHLGLPSSVPTRGTAPPAPKPGPDDLSDVPEGELDAILADFEALYADEVR